MTTDFSLLRYRLETERESLLERLKTNVRPADETRESSPHGEEEEVATETLELEKHLLQNGMREEKGGSRQNQRRCTCL